MEEGVVAADVRVRVLNYDSSDSHEYYDECEKDGC